MISGQFRCEYPGCNRFHSDSSSNFCERHRGSIYARQGGYLLWRILSCCLPAGNERPDPALRRYYWS